MHNTLRRERSGKFCQTLSTDHAIQSIVKHGADWLEYSAKATGFNPWLGLCVLHLKEDTSSTFASVKSAEKYLTMLDIVRYVVYVNHKCCLCMMSIT